MHPNHVDGENPGEHEHIDDSENETSESQPCESRQCFKYSVMKFNPTARAPGEQPADKTENIDDFPSQDA